jgi:ribosomal protein S18 acetylase RimI-like enzyme
MTEPAPDTFDIRAVTIRLARDSDLPTIHELFRRSMLEGMLRDNDTGADMENLQDAYFSDEGNSGFWVAEDEGKVVGMVGVQKTRENTAEIRRLRVLEEFRRRGVGTKLMEQALNFCREHGYLKVILDVRIERGPAIAMFEKFGFTLARVREIGSHKTLDFYLDLYRESKSD